MGPADRPPVDLLVVAEVEGVAGAGLLAAASASASIGPADLPPFDEEDVAAAPLDESADVASAGVLASLSSGPAERPLL